MTENDGFPRPGFARVGHIDCGIRRHSRFRILLPPSARKRVRLRLREEASVRLERSSRQCSGLQTICNRFVEGLRSWSPSISLHCLELCSRWSRSVGIRDSSRRSIRSSPSPTTAVGKELIERTRLHLNCHSNGSTVAISDDEDVLAVEVGGPGDITSAASGTAPGTSLASATAPPSATTFALG
jgi:hypothetical protein